MTSGKSQVLSAKETRALVDGIDVTNLAGLRDCAFMGVHVCSFARVSRIRGGRGRATARDDVAAPCRTHRASAPIIIRP